MSRPEFSRRPRSPDRRHIFRDKNGRDFRDDGNTSGIDYVKRGKTVPEPAQEDMHPGQYVLKEIYGLSNAPDEKSAHRHLVHIRSLSVHPDRRSEIISAGGVPVIITCLERFGPQSDTVARQACAALQNLSLEKEGAATVSEHWGVPQIVRAMAVHSRNPGVQEMGCAALRNLTAGYVDNRAEVARVGGVRVVVCALREHTNIAKICDKGIAALGNLCLKNPENRRVIGKEGGVVAILNAMREHSRNEPVIEKGVRTLWDLAHNRQNVELMNAEEGITDFLLGLGVRFPNRCKKKAIQIYLRL